LYYVNNGHLIVMLTKHKFLEMSICQKDKYSV